MGIECIERDFHRFAVAAVDQREREVLEGVVIKTQMPVIDDENDDENEDEDESAESIRMRSSALLADPDHSLRARTACTSSSA
ncbi:hypothetical protein AMAG_15745 [Allomyces macrogynus ATCC 38327]|uniref:Uncharacterized protein n=1 Tax=Allomyces macrogynus (strain ATCC 38327) TaxID=578462 RepID=A0A0L0TA05_ALLM3|nr:hypothetical protein AMAG_15745 [Allomyces macrogynus ATCC 38327]|eukprot:KNE71530.1 hypothetical protein AMAG_15745 [Allomyces macrogynus ATCC 38327]